MIDYLRGILSEKEVAHVTIDVHGVGYGAGIPLSTFETLPDIGAEVKLYIYYQVREDAHKLYGFSTKTEKDVFIQLIGITKIGPKVALSVLSGISITDLVQSVNAADPSRLEKIPGVGPKTAQRLVLELKGKLGNSLSGLSSAPKLQVSKTTAVKQEKVLVRDEAFDAMISLGYNDKQVLKALSRVEQTVDSSAPVEEWIRKALQVI
jgi:Holliday junction DNA helicase RuvA